MRVCLYIMMIFFCLVGLKAQDSASPEMQTYRDILNSKKVTYQDLADIILMERGEFDQYATPEARVNRMREAGIYDVAGQAGEFATAGAVAKAVMNQFKIPRGIFFTLTGFERYALRDLQDLQLILPTYSQFSKLTGSQLVGVLTEADDFRSQVKYWGKSRLEILELEARAEEEELGQ